MKMRLLLLAFSLMQATRVMAEPIDLQAPQARQFERPLFYRNTAAMVSHKTPTIFVFDVMKGFIPDPNAKEDKDEVKKFIFDPYYGFIDAQKKPEARPKFVFDQLYGYVPALEQEQSRIQSESKFVFNPTYGYTPVQQEGADEIGDPEFTYTSAGFVPDTSVDGKPVTKYVRNERFGFIPTSLQEKSSSMFTDEFMRHPYYGFIPVPKDDVMKDEKPKRYLYDPLRGFVLKPSEEAKESKVTQYVFHGQLGFVPIRDVPDNDRLQTYKLDPFYGYVPLPEREEVKAEDQIYVRHPFYGYMLAADKKPNEKFVYHPVFGFVPKAELPKLLNQNPSQLGNLPGPKQVQSDTSATPVLPIKDEGIDQLETNVADNIDVRVAKREAQLQLLPALPYPVLLSPQPIVYLSPVTAIQARQNAPGLEQSTEAGESMAQDAVTQQTAAAEDELEEEPTQTEVVPVGPTLFNPLLQPSVIVPAGSIVSNQALPESTFPIFPYDPEQDKPGASVF